MTVTLASQTFLSSEYTPDGQGRIIGLNKLGIGAPRAFPGAEGPGTTTRGGSGSTTPTIYVVSNLNDSGTGSFREACEAVGPRHVLFAVSGTINLASALVIYNPYLTIAGQTSSGGICVAGAVTIINTHDVIVRHMRFRPGSHNNGGDVTQSRGLEITGAGAGYAGLPNDCYNVVVDHCSVSWTTDQAVTVESDAYDVTLSHNLIAGPLDNASHGFNLFFWGRYTDPSRQYAAHHNVTLHGRNRNPEINFNGQLDYYNNVNYNSNFGGAFSSIGGDSPTAIKLNIRHNYNKYGPDTLTANNNKPYMWFESPPAAPVGGMAFVEGNIGPHRTSQSDAENLSTSLITYDPSFSFTTPAPSSYLANTPFTFLDSVITEMNAAYAQVVVNDSGATVPTRDSVDAQFVNDFATDGGSVVSSVSYPSDWPDLAIGAPAAPTDTNSDGIPDAYEVFKGEAVGSLSPNSVAPSGYTWIEQYEHDLADGTWSIV